ncbi:MAG TPA: ABC transporter substrate-binding protein [Alphaproteobacteria bacterium]|nr:ABC transporter substrate-binding protein [Alphaproteobacteria bacterium]
MTRSKIAATATTRRTLLKGALAASALVSAPAFLRKATAATPIKIGIPTVITGGYAILGAQTIRTCKLVKKLTDAKGGVLGRPIEFLYQDTTGDPAICVRKCQEFVERDDCHLITGVVVSSEAAAIMPKLEEWNAFFISNGNGDGRLTAELFVPRFFRANTSAPMGARTIALYLKDAPQKKFVALGSDYSWGQSSVKAFEEQTKKIGKTLVDKIFTPVANKDYSTYITKILQSGAEGCYLALQGDEARAFFSQSTQYELTKHVQIFTEIVAQADIKTLGKDALGLIGSSRYPFTYDIPENKAFVAAFTEEYKGELPDWPDGEIYQALQILFKAMEKADSIEPLKLVAAMEDLEVTSVKGPVLMRKCDHQGENQGFLVKVAEDAKYKEPIPEIVKIYPRHEVTPDCRSSSYSS